MATTADAAADAPADQTLSEWYFSMREKVRELDIPWLDDLEERTGMDKVDLVQVALLLAFVVFVGGVGVGTLCNIVGFAYPGYASFRVLERPAVVRTGQVRLWLMFWIVFACFKFIELFADRFLGWVPYYNTLKFGAMLTLFVPSTARATSFYSNNLVPFIQPNESEVDKLVRTTQLEADRVAARVYETDLAQDVMRFFKGKSNTKSD